MAFAAGLTAHHLEHMRLFMTDNDKGADTPSTFYAKLKARL